MVSAPRHAESAIADPLDVFSEPVARWFRTTHGSPTEPQREAWPRIIRGENVLIHSPTGSGKTLAAFLSALDGLYNETSTPNRKGVRTLYISPLKALGYDVERNLRDPMRGIEHQAAAMGIEVPEVRAEVRTGDTPSNERARMVRNPPHILITTPESLYLILTSPRARAMLGTVETVIVDEIHTLCANKRGVHLSITLERLEQIAPKFQRIGLSATQRPLSEVARLLGGQTVEVQNENGIDAKARPRNVAIVDCPGSKRIEISVHGMAESPGADPGSLWPKLIPTVLDDIDQHDTTLVFTNSRRQAENTADRLNAGHDARIRGADESNAVGSGFIGAGVDDGPFLAHHGSLSDTMRRDIEEQLKAGELPALVGTSSLELGIDIGSIDLVVQLQSPKTVTQGLQRVGRAGHSVGETSVGKIYATHPEDLMEAVVVAKGMQERRVEEVVVPTNSLDVLAQQIVAAVSVQDWDVHALYQVVKGAYPYRDLDYSSYLGAVKLVSGHYPRELFSSLRARIHWDQTRDILQALPGTRMLAISNGGAIVDRGAFSVVLPDHKTRIGELDEEFVFESGEGDAFMLGSQVWRVSKIEDDRVIAEPAPGAAPRMPFWRGDFPWRPLDLSQTLARFRAEAAERIKPHVDDETAPSDVVRWLRNEYPVDDTGARQIIDYVRRQVRWSGDISSHKTIIVETYQDSIGDTRIVVHSPFGGRINGPWSVAIGRELLRRKKVEPEVQVSDDGFMFRLPQSDDETPIEFIGEMTSDQAKEHILDGLIDSPLFGAVFRQNAYRAMLLPSPGQFRRTPFWLQRLRAKDLLAIAKSFPDFPIVLESYRDALEDFMDMPGLERVLDNIANGDIEVKHVASDVPSPVARALDYNFIGFWMYQWDTPKAERSLQTLNIDRDALAELFRKPESTGLLRRDAIDEVASLASRLATGARARTITELAQLFSELGDLTEAEIGDRCDGDWESWLRELESAGRVVLITFDVDGKREGRWISAMLEPEYMAAILEPADYGAVRRVVARFLARSGPVSLPVLQSRYPINSAAIIDALDEMMSDATAASGYFSDSGVEEWLDLAMLAKIQERTLAILRSEVKPSDPIDYQAGLLKLHDISRLTGASSEDTTSSAIERLAGVPIRAESWTSNVLPARVDGFRSTELEALIEDGEFRWVFCQDPKREGISITLVNLGDARAYLSQPTLDAILAGSEQLPSELQVLHEFIASEGIVDSETILAGVESTSPSQLTDAIRDLALRGLVTADRWSIAMAISRSSLNNNRNGTDHPIPPAPPRRRGGRRSMRRQFAERYRHNQGILVPGANWSATLRFSFLGPNQSDETLARIRAEKLLARHGVVTRRAIESDALGWDWRPIQAALNLMELRGTVRRGYFVEGLPGVQFATTEFVDLMRSQSDSATESTASVVSATDPAYVFDRRLASVSRSSAAKLLEAPRIAGRRIVFIDGSPIIAASSDGANIETAGASDGDIERALRAYAKTNAATSSTRRCVVKSWNGKRVIESSSAPLLAKVGFRRDYPNMVYDALSETTVGA